MTSNNEMNGETIEISGNKDIYELSVGDIKSIKFERKEEQLVAINKNITELNDIRYDDTVYLFDPEFYYKIVEFKKSNISKEKIEAINFGDIDKKSKIQFQDIKLDGKDDNNFEVSRINLEFRNSSQSTFIRKEINLDQIPIIEINDPKFILNRESDWLFNSLSEANELVISYLEFQSKTIRLKVTKPILIKLRD
ncbi:MAG: hypothetical protein HRU40_12220 [Saprospiraceae bacterium]|nr:hypothetical protein [Saprospiraceae bacterium]